MLTLVKDLLRGCSVFIFVANTTAFAAQVNVVAKVTDVSSMGVRANSSAGSLSKQLEYLDDLVPGQVLEIEDGADLVLIYLDSGIEYAYSGAGRVQVGAESPKSLEGTKARMHDYEIEQSTGMKLSGDHDIDDQAAYVFRSLSRGEDSIKLLSPRGGKIVSSTPLFSWEQISGARGYKLVLLNDYEEIEFEIELGTNHFNVPNDSPLERNRTYTWRVTSVVDGKLISGEAVFFLVDRTTVGRLKTFLNSLDRTPAAKSLGEILLVNNGFDSRVFELLSLDDK